MFRFLSKCIGIAAGQATPKTAVTTKPQQRPQLECLEERLALSTIVLPASAAVNPHGDLVITGTAGKDNVVVSYQVVNNVGYYKVTENGVNHWFSASRVSSGNVYFHGG